MKKIINDPTTVTTEALQGMAEAHADLLRVELAFDLLDDGFLHGGSLSEGEGGWQATDRPLRTRGRDEIA